MHFWFWGELSLYISWYRVNIKVNPERSISKQQREYLAQLLKQTRLKCIVTHFSICPWHLNNVKSDRSLLYVWTHRRRSWRSCSLCPPCPPVAPVWGRPDAEPGRSETPHTHGSRWGTGLLFYRETKWVFLLKARTRRQKEELNFRIFLRYFSILGSVSFITWHTHDQVHWWTHCSRSLLVL